MAAGDVVFSRDLEEETSEIWDDTALIQAYDEAVNSMKVHLAGKMGGTPQQTTATGPNNSGQPKTKKHKKNRKHKSKKPKDINMAASRHGQVNSADSTSLAGCDCSVSGLSGASGRKHAGSRDWRIGNQCRAIYSEDGQIYEAVIVALNNNKGLCRVRYAGYGNEEEHSLDDLLISRERNFASSDRERPSSVASSHCSEPIDEKNFPKLPFSHFGSGVEMCPPPPMFGSLGDVPDSSFPVPDGAESSEALHSMLISWYMSGYHTGYYQGLRQGRPHSTTATTKAKDCFTAEPSSHRETITKTTK